MRDIRFRCWDGKTMWPHAVPLFNRAFNGGTINVSKNSEGVSNDFVNGQLLQFTGLKDKTGRDIFEGDILQMCWKNGKPCGVGFLVEWVPEGVRFTDWHPRDTVKIIGNVFENPELLTKEQE